MKFIRGLSSITLVSCLSVSSGAAVAKVTEPVSNPTSSAQTESAIIANPLEFIRDTIRTVDQLNQIRLREQRRQEAERRRQELEAARREATEQQRLEAERRQQYFESLSPEEQQAYIQEQRALQAQREKEANLFLLGVMSLMFGGSSSDTGAEGSPNDLCYVYNSDGTMAYTTTRDRISNFSGVECRSR
jgi:hypothetical protein